MNEHFDFTDTSVDHDAASVTDTDDYSDNVDHALGDSLAAPSMPTMPSMDYDDSPSAVSAPDMPDMPTMTPDAAPGVPDPSVPDLSEPPTESPSPAVVPEPTTDPDPTLVPEPADVPPPAPEPADVPPPADGVPVPEDGSYGTPTAWTADWFFQEVDGYCGPSSIAQVVSEYTGLNITDPQQLVDRALELGLFPNNDPSMGMTSADMEILMEDQGVPCHLENSSMQDLEAKLSEGYGVIAMVDSGEIWYPGTETYEDNTPDHALVVAGIDEDRGVVILSDPGNPDGNQFEISIDEFDNAWADSDHEMLVADATDPDLADTTTVDPDLAALAPKPWALIPLT